MKLVIFGLTISSSWGNGHATLWRGLCRALHDLGHGIVFYERDLPYYRNARDWNDLPFGELVLYERWADVGSRVARDLIEADAAIVTSYCPDALSATDAMRESPRSLRVFYDLDTPVTLAAMQAGEPVSWLGERGLRDFDLVLSYTGGAALDELRARLGARCVHTLHGHVDPRAHSPVPPMNRYRADLSWLGTYAADRQRALVELFVRPAVRQPGRRFLIGGAQYPANFPWSPNVYFVRHVPPGEHPAFFSSARLTLNVTREAMARTGWSPSGRLFEAAACGAAIVTDEWPGLSDFYSPGIEVLTARTADEVLSALQLDDAALRRVGQAARERTMQEHTSMHRARRLIDLIEQAGSRSLPSSGRTVRALEPRAAGH